MKKLLSICLLPALLFFALPADAADENDITVKLDNLEIDFDVPPSLEKSRVLVPFRLPAQKLQVDVNWNEQTRTIEASGPDIRVTIPVGETTATVNGREIELDMPAVIENGRTLVPLRFFAESMGAEVHWESSSRLVTIFSPVRKTHISAVFALGSSEASSWTELFGAPYPETANGKTGMIKDVQLGWYSLDDQGTLLTDSNTGWVRPTGWERVLEEINSHNNNTEMLIHATDINNRITDLTSDPASIERFSRSIAEEAYLYDGVNLNLEGLGLSQSGQDLERVQNDFIELVRAVREQLDNDKTLSLTIHAPNTSYRGYNYSELEPYADRIIMMAHDYGPEPEPDSKVTEAVEMALKSVPAEKLVLAISAPSETAVSIRTRIGIAKSNGLAGISLWRLGIIGEEKWEQIEKTILPL